MGRIALDVSRIAYVYVVMTVQWSAPGRWSPEIVPSESRTARPSNQFAAHHLTGPEMLAARARTERAGVGFAARENSAKRGAAS